MFHVLCNDDQSEPLCIYLSRNNGLVLFDRFVMIISNAKCKITFLIYFSTNILVVKNVNVNHLYKRVRMSQYTKDVKLGRKVLYHRIPSYNIVLPS